MNDETCFLSLSSSSKPRKMKEARLDEREGKMWLLGEERSERWELVEKLHKVEGIIWRQ